ncbi:hypothetical protein [Mitsuaria sp. GD03876]|uniref:Dyp-type peroxidase n=1 Tax=Mitsuaria sp. GD03876 TaxID=2975399 RepID=UPI00244BCC56|nr:hypothetical protein [Mitsuaria sp. GD03876]MDH0863906.1 hypothetical protein [Mitsuaria sp. GD03876]
MSKVQSMVTIVAPLAKSRVADVGRQIAATLGNPAIQPFRDALEQGARFLHFASLHALERQDGEGDGGHLILELSGDGDERQVVREFAARAAPWIEPLFQSASDWRAGQDLAAYLEHHRRAVGFGLFDNPDLAFCGTPGQTVESILEEERLARAVAEILARPAVGVLPPLGKLEAVRRDLQRPGPTPAATASAAERAWLNEGADPVEEPTLLKKALALGPSFVVTFLWPVLLALLPLCLWLAWPRAWSPRGAIGFVAAVAGLELAFTLVILGVVYLVFRRQEDSDPVSDRGPASDELQAMVARENALDHVQNHMMSCTVLKPGRLRGLTIRLAFWAVATLNAMNPRVGRLGDIGTIHFARWIMIPGTRDLVFFSNFGGSWESYLEDFITKAHAGLTAVWSNTTGFPRSRRLFQDGATDGERFKRYARQSMRHTPFWYCAYPSLTTDNIRTHRRIRCGLDVAETEADAVHWLTNFGSLPRPVEKLETTQIQSLVFGGMKFKPEGRLLVIDLGPDVALNRRWLGDVLPLVAFNDGRYETRPALLSLATSARGLGRLGLPAEAVDSFPAAFTQGMHGPGRERILGDLGPNARDAWDWGQAGNDVALLVYGDTTNAVDALADHVGALCARCGATVAMTQDLTRVGESLSERKEPFGFVDGVSQPAMRGTYRGLRNDDPIHLVEPGEFVLGYPDNRGNVPPGPMMDARHDPGMLLPVAGKANGYPQGLAGNPRLIGYNGSFLVIRHLRQDADGFQRYCRQEGMRLKDAFPDLPLMPGEDGMAAYIGAKMIGRWQDGSSLIRNPYIPASELRQRTGTDPAATTARSESLPVAPAAAPIPAADKQGAAPRRDIKPDNDFLFGTEDPQGLRCPFGAHVRRANPRESLSRGSNDQIAISNRHRILRVGRGYLGQGGKTEGLMFMCLNGDIERQFEFIQQTWMGSTKFHGLSAETDPIAGRGLPGGDGFTIPTRRGPVGLKSLPQFVTVRGGGYFFLPGRQLLNYLATGPGTGAPARA